VENEDDDELCSELWTLAQQLEAQRSLNDARKLRVRRAIEESNVLVPFEVLLVCVAPITAKRRQSTATYLFCFL
jgi:hypothetical protein